MTIETGSRLNIVAVNPGTQYRINLEKKMSQEDFPLFDLKQYGRVEDFLKNENDVVHAVLINTDRMRAEFSDQNIKDVCSSISLHSKSAAIVFFSDEDHPDIEKSALRHGAQAYFTQEQMDSPAFARQLYGAILRQSAIVNAIRQMHYDRQTKLPNPLLFNELLHQAINHTRRRDRILALLWIRIRFKDAAFSDGNTDMISRGVRIVANRIKQTLRENDIVSKLGQMDFAVVYTDLVTPGDAERATQRLLKSVREPLVLNQEEQPHLVTVGISMYPVDGGDIDSLLDKAKSALPHTSNDFETGYHFASQDIKASVVDRLALEESLDRALAENQFELQYQPQVDLHSGSIMGLETFIQWRHPELGLLPAKRWIQLAKDLGKIVDIGAYVLKQAAGQFKNWLDQGCEPFELAINFSTREFVSSKLNKLIKTVLDDTGIDPQLLVLEFPEDSMLAHGDRAVRHLNDLTKMGVKCSLDNFGFGYASLIQLKLYPFHELKIDRSLISGIVDEKYDRMIVSAIIAMAHTIGLTVSAAGVETQEQYHILKEAGCDRVQGYYFSRPLPPAEVFSLLSGNRKFE